MKWGWVLPEKQNQIAVVGRSFTLPPLIANRYVANMKLSDWKTLSSNEQKEKCQHLNPYEEWDFFKEIEAEFINEFSCQDGVGKVFCGLGSSMGQINSISVTIIKGKTRTTLPEFFLGFPVTKQYEKEAT